MDISISSSSCSYTIRNIYAPPNNSSSFWFSFPPLPSSPNLICSGDFNITTQLCDRWSSQPNSQNFPNTTLFSQHFPNLIDLAGSLPGPPRFTLFRNYSTYSSKSRIDYILISPSLFSSSLSSFTFYMGSLSDHRALILKPSPSRKHTLWRMNTSYLQKPYIQSDISSILNTYTSPSHPYLWDICKTDIIIKSFYFSRVYKELNMGGERCLDRGLDRGLDIGKIF